MSDLIRQKIIHSKEAYSFFGKFLYCDQLKNPGQLGHYISFYRIFRTAVDHKLKYFMIVEDDAIFTQEVSTKVSALVSFLHKNNYAFASLGQAEYFYQKTKSFCKVIIV